MGAPLEVKWKYLGHERSFPSRLSSASAASPDDALTRSVTTY